MLNEGNKTPYLYFNEDVVGDLIIFSVKDKNEKFLFNIIDIYEKTPSNMSVNFRILSHIKSDLIEYNNLKLKNMSKLSKPKSFTVSNETIEVNFQGTKCQCANLLKSGITNQTIVLVDYGGKWHEINILDLGGDDSNLQAFKNFIETMKLGLVDLGIISETVKTDYSLKHQDFMDLSDKFPAHDYIQISRLNDYNVANGEKASVYNLTDWLKVCQRDKISIDELIQNRENEKQKIINPKNAEKMNEKIIKESFDEEVINLEVRDDGQTAIPVESIEVMGIEIVLNETVKSSVLVAEFDLPKTPAKKPISLQVFETLTPERISELQGLNESQLAIVKANPVIQITDKKTYELAKKTAATLLKASTAIDGSAGIEATATKYLNTFKSMLKNALQPIAKLTRDPYDEQKIIISSWENAELLREQAEQRAKLAKIKLRTDELFAVPFTFNGTIYSIGTAYCTPSQVETATDEDFKVIVESGRTVKQALDAELAIQAGKDKEIADLKAKLVALTQLSEISNTEPIATPANTITEMPVSNIPASNPNSVGPQSGSMNPIPKNSILGQAEAEKLAPVLPAADNKLLNALDLEHLEHVAKPAYIKCRGYYVRGLIDASKEIEFILNDVAPNLIKKSERIANLCEILKKSA